MLKKMDCTMYIEQMKFYWIKYTIRVTIKQLLFFYYAYSKL